MQNNKNYIRNLKLFLLSILFVLHQIPIFSVIDREIVVRPNIKYEIEKAIHKKDNNFILRCLTNRQILIDEPIDYDKKFTLMHLAVSSGNKELVAELLKRKANINYEDDEFSLTPICCCINLKDQNSAIDMFEFLIAKGAKVDYRCIACAISKEKIPFLKYLLNNETYSSDFLKRKKIIYNAVAFANNRANFKLSEYLLSFPQIRKAYTQIRKKYMSSQNSEIKLEDLEISTIIDVNEDNLNIIQD